MSGLYSSFKTDENFEKEGVWFDYGSFRIRAGYAGGANKKYTSLAEKKFKPLRRALETGAISNERSLAILIDVFANAIIFDWETMVDGEYRKGIEAPDGSLLPFNVENVIMTFTNLPNLFQDIQSQCNQISNYKNRDLEAEAGN